MVLLLHLVRGDDAFNMAFDTRWRCAFVDSVGDGDARTSQDGGLPTAIDAAGRSVLDIVRGLDPSEVIQRGKRDGRIARETATFDILGVSVMNMVIVRLRVPTMIESEKRSIFSV